MSKLESFKKSVSDHKEEILGYAIIGATVVAYAALVKYAVKAEKQERRENTELKKAYIEFLNRNTPNTVAP